MGQVRTAVHATAGAAPGDVLARTNRVLMDFATDLFVSCLYIHIDLAERRIHLASAGHPPPLLRSPDPALHTVALSVEPGPLLGIRPCTEADYPAATVPLPAGSLLALYTDGLVEPPRPTSPTPSPTSPTTSPGPATGRSMPWRTASSTTPAFNTRVRTTSPCSSCAAGRQSSPPRPAPTRALGCAARALRVRPMPPHCEGLCRRRGREGALSGCRADGPPRAARLRQRGRRSSTSAPGRVRGRELRVHCGDHEPGAAHPAGA
ncbi:SpoIIE family protein phosphatase [Streptomyces sp. NPDC058295]|uniref:PP2C family protein-serine/threonine phosphatase n=1 Tax=Streptomyces sp. NPDC058295 TaxID=3346431 RepID=UPI0036E27CF6